MNAPDNMTIREYDKTLWNCRVRGVACEYGICDECPNTRGRDNDESQEKEEEA